MGAAGEHPATLDPMSTTNPAADPTLNPDLKSWLPSANDPATDFPLQNLPLCTFQGENNRPSVGIAVGDAVVDVDMLMHGGVLGDDEPAERLHHAVHAGVMNFILAQPDLRRVLRERVQDFLIDKHAGQQQRRLRDKALRAIADTRFSVPCVIRNYTDFYASIDHARRVGSMFRPDNPLLPNYKHVPIGYHGRASSIVVSGTSVTRPSGQTKPDGLDAPVFGPSKRLDFELEVGCLIGPGNALGSPIPAALAHEHIAGVCLVNDWSARDIQAWEYQPLGPFLAKNFATSVSPFIVTADAFNPFRVPGPPREAGDPAPMGYLADGGEWGLDLHLEVRVQSATMRERGLSPHPISRTNLRGMFWTFPQMVAHHASNGCNLLPGDLLASGTVSGSTPASRGCLLEATWAGTGPDGKPLPRTPLELPSGEKRTFLEDGDEVIFTGWFEDARARGLRRIGLGECRGRVLPAKA